MSMKLIPSSRTDSPAVIPGNDSPHLSAKESIVVTLATGTPSQRRKPRPSTGPAHRADWKLAIVLILPATVGFIVFAAGPVLRGIYLSFTKFRILTPATWTGLDNYRRLL